MEWILGIDAGGTTARISGEAAEEANISWEQKHAAQADGLPHKEWFALPDAHDRVLAVCAAVAKWSRPDVRAGWEEVLAKAFPHARIELVPDFVAAFAGALADAEGIVAVAGTGSVVYGENADGQSARVGGRGWEWGDEGSGAWLTNEIVRRTLRACDGVAPHTDLTKRLCAQWQTEDAGQIAARARETTQTEGRGFLVPFAVQQMQNGNEEARNLFVGAGGWLGVQVQATARQLGWQDGDTFVVATAGGLWETGAVLRDAFMQIVQRRFPQARVVPAQADACTGARKRAGRLLTRSAPPLYTEERNARFDGL